MDRDLLAAEAELPAAADVEGCAARVVAGPSVTVRSTDAVGGDPVQDGLLAARRRRTTAARRCRGAGARSRGSPGRAGRGGRRSRSARLSVAGARVRKASSRGWPSRAAGVLGDPLVAGRGRRAAGAGGVSSGPSSVDAGVGGRASPSRVSRAADRACCARPRRCGVDAGPCRRRPPADAPASAESSSAYLAPTARSGGQRSSSKALRTACSRKRSAAAASGNAQPRAAWTRSRGRAPAPPSATTGPSANSGPRRRRPRRCRRRCATTAHRAVGLRRDRQRATCRRARR